MYIDKLQIENFRCFDKQSIEFMHPDSPRATGARFPNVNVVLGANGVGKTTLLKAAALATLNPLFGQTGFRPYQLVRREPEKKFYSLKKDFKSTIIYGVLKLEKGIFPEWIPPQLSTQLRIKISKSAEKIDDDEIATLELEQILGDIHKIEIPQNLSDLSKLFAVSYGAMRRVERLPSYDFADQNKAYSYRYSRMANLFDSRVVLTPLISWLPQLPKLEKEKILELFKKLMPTNLEFSDSIEGREFSFYHNKILVPFDALADGHRSYIGWVSDLLYHLHRANPKNPTDVSGVVLVDEVDLLAHPTWQRSIVPDLAKTFPKLQFIVTTHSPIVAASVEAANLFILEPGKNGTAKITRPDAEVYGLNAQQVLHEVFGMDSTRAPEFEKDLDKLRRKSRAGDRVATRELMQGLAYGAGKPIPIEEDLDLVGIQKAAKAMLESNS